MKSPKIIELINVEKDYVNEDIITPVLHEINITVHQGEFVAITGPSGSGKSTLLNILGLLDTPTRGKYILNGNDVTNLSEIQLAGYRNKEIGFVFQSFNLLKRSLVIDNVILPSIYAGTKKSVRVERARELLTIVGLSEQMYKKPNQLSGGQQQRVAIARSLMNEPSILLADEPTGNLDSKSGTEIMLLLKNLNKKGRTIIMITHDPILAREAQRTITIKDGRVTK